MGKGDGERKGGLRTSFSLFISLNPHSVCSACPSNTFSISTNAGYCSGYSSCGYGQYVVVSGTATSDLQCGACTLGLNYMDQTNQQSVACKPVSPTCGIGQYQTVAPTLSNNRVCATCPANTFTTTTNTLSCTAATVCPVGTAQSVAPTSSSDRYGGIGSFGFIHLPYVLLFRPSLLPHRPPLPPAPARPAMV